jgi:hypothetical protein
MADPMTGWRRVVQLGNVQERTDWRLSYALPVGHASGRLYWSVQAVDGAFAGSPFADEQTFTPPSDVESDLPHDLSLALQGANPVAGVAHFRFGLPKQAQVALTIHDVTGRRMATLATGDYEAGYHVVSWESRKEAPPAGIYFARFKADGQSITRRVVMLR